MKRFNDSLKNVHVASPCPANWDEMLGDARKRYCGDCKLNVYNLSDMTSREAQDLIFNAEGRLCVRYYRRSDGSVLTKDCPVGWHAIKRRVSKVATAAFSMVAGLFAGTSAYSLFDRSYVSEEPEMGAVVTVNETQPGDEIQMVPVVGVLIEERPTKNLKIKRNIFRRSQRTR